MANELIDSFFRDLEKRLTTPLYGTFFVSWAILHWKFFITLFFVSEEKIWEVNKLLKNDYLSKILFNCQDWHSWLSWILPFFITWLIIWKFPKWLSLPAFRQEAEYKTSKEIIKIRERKKIESEKTKLEEINIKNLEMVSERTKKEEEIVKLDPTISWKQEYENFINSNFFNKLDLLIDLTYKHNGYLHSDYNKMEEDFLAYLHSNELIEIDQTKATIDITKKGKFFIKQYTLDKAAKIPF